MTAVDALARVDAWPASHRVLRLVVLAGPLVALACSVVASEPARWWVWPLVALLAVGWAAAPGSGVGGLTLAAVVVRWAQADGDALHVAVVPAAAALLAAHVAALLCATAPPGAALDRRVARLWAGRAAGVLVAAPVLWLLAGALRDGGRPDALWPAALAVVLVLVAGAAVLLAAPRDGVRGDW
ncbi:hypothetical protein GCM10023340_44570 [Nocardioides marinquilinus]|uniref:Histidine kinase n=1 Tax=Nocardioides marinquilinus TaxID=1210400 RepID=A0ABP9Q3Z5_9ACTN